LTFDKFFVDELEFKVLGDLVLSAVFEHFLKTVPGEVVVVVGNDCGLELVFEVVALVFALVEELDEFEGGDFGRRVGFELEERFAF
jgi:hypothetical protein